MWQVVSLLETPTIGLLKIIIKKSMVALLEMRSYVLPHMTLQRAAQHNKSIAKEQKLLFKETESLTNARLH